MKITYTVYLLHRSARHRLISQFELNDFPGAAELCSAIYRDDVTSDRLDKDTGLGAYSATGAESVGCWVKQ